MQSPIVSEGLTRTRQDYAANREIRLLLVEVRSLAGSVESFVDCECWSAAADASEMLAGKLRELKAASVAQEERQRELSFEAVNPQRQFSFAAPM